MKLLPILVLLGGLVALAFYPLDPGGQLGHFLVSHHWVIANLYLLAGDTGLRLLALLGYLTVQTLVGLQIWSRTKSPLTTALTLAFSVVLYREAYAPLPEIFSNVLVTFIVLYLFDPRRPSPNPWLVAACLTLGANLHPGILVAVPFLLLRKDWRYAAAALAVFASPRGWSIFNDASFYWTGAHALRDRAWLNQHRLYVQIHGFAIDLVPSTVLFLLAAIVLVDKKRNARVAVASVLSFFFANLKFIEPLTLALIAPRLHELVTPKLARIQMRVPVQIALGYTAAILILFLGNVPFSPFALSLPVKALDFVNQTGMKGRLWTEPEWRSYAAWKVNGSLQSSPRREANVAMLHWDTKTNVEWRVVYENNIAKIALRVGSDTENLQSARNYYDSHKVTLGEKEFSLRAVYFQNAEWLKSQRQDIQNGPLPESWIPISAALDEASFYVHQEAAPLAVDRLKEALLQDENNLELSVAMGYALVVSGRAAEAKNWLSYLSTLHARPQDVAAIRSEIKKIELAGRSTANKQ